MKTVKTPETIGEMIDFLGTFPKDAKMNLFMRYVTNFGIGVNRVLHMEITDQESVDITFNSYDFL